MITIPKDKWFLPTNYKKPIIECPSCGGGLLGDGAPHTIHPDGTVTRSVVCGHHGCKFHAYVKLEGWTADEIAK